MAVGDLLPELGGEDAEDVAPVGDREVEVADAQGDVVDVDAGHGRDITPTVWLAEVS